VLVLRDTHTLGTLTRYADAEQSVLGTIRGTQGLLDLAARRWQAARNSLEDLGGARRVVARLVAVGGNHGATGDLAGQPVDVATDNTDIHQHAVVELGKLTSRQAGTVPGTQRGNDVLLGGGEEALGLLVAVVERADIIRDVVAVQADISQHAV